jgi:hypothetical protein
MHPHARRRLRVAPPPQLLSNSAKFNHCRKGVLTRAARCAPSRCEECACDGEFAQLALNEDDDVFAVGEGPDFLDGKNEEFSLFG